MNYNGIWIIQKNGYKNKKSYIDLPKFWTEYFSKGYGKIVEGAMGICQQESLDSEEFKYSIGCEYSQGACIPDGFGIITIPASTWAVFKCVGAMPKAIQDIWNRIYSEWLPQAEYDRIQEYDFERYTEGNNQSQDYVSEIWIPVKKK